jgi:hypothetical protein
MSYLVNSLILLAALGVTLQYGAAFAFVWIYLPVLLLMSHVAAIPVPGLPDITSPFGALYGIGAGMFLRGQWLPNIRWNLVDAVVLSIAACKVISSGTTEQLWTAVSSSGEQVLDWVFPYVLARMMFQSEKLRADALKVIIACMLVIAFFALIEARLWPYLYSRNLQAMGLFDDPSVEVLRRYGLFRAEVSFRHPIDLGNVSVLILGMIVMLAVVTPVGLNNIYVKAGIAASLISLVAAISFTAYLGIAAAAGVFLLLRYFRSARVMLRMGVILVIVGGCLATMWLLDRPLGDHPKDSATALEGSLWIRTLIVQNSWKLASTAGLFGWGKVLKSSDLNLESVDNAYILIVLWSGWVSLGFWVLLPVVLGKRVSRALRQASTPRQVMPLAVGVAAVLGTMVGMYTVWFGYVYANLFVIMIGFTTTLADMFLETASEAPATIEARSEDRAIASPSAGFPSFPLS